MEEVKIRELPEKENVQITDYVIVEDDDGTKKTLIRHFRSLVLNTLYFNNIDELKNDLSRGLKDGDICQTLGYYEPGDGGGALYQIKYDPAAVEDNMLIHYLSYSDTLRAEIILDNTINVNQFGAKGDGKHDDSSAIQCALNNAWKKTIEFTHGKKYLTKTQLNIINDGIIINGHGAILYPQYVTGLSIAAESDTANDVHDIYINNLNIDGSNATNSIYINKASNIHIYKSIITCSEGKGGIVLKNSNFINIENCEFDSDRGSSIVLEGDKNACVRSLNIHSCKFSSFSKAIHILSTGIASPSNNITVSIEGCTFDSDIINSTSIYVACLIEYMDIKNNIITRCTKFLYYSSASGGNIYCNGLSCSAITTLFDFEAANGTLHLDGNIRKSSTTNTVTTLFNKLNGKLHSNILWDKLSNMTIEINTSNVPSGELIDITNPVHYGKSGYGISGSQLTLRSCHNVNIDWNSSTNNLESIVGGIKGQMIYITSSTGKYIVGKEKKIILPNQSTQLGTYGIVLQYDGLQWVQIYI